MHTLVGEDHRELVDELVSRVITVANGDVSVPRIVILEGASGLGKSRIVREVYRELCARLDPDSYWPELDESGGGDARSRDPMPGRKRIGPDVDGFVWPADVLPGFAWWQLQCEQMRSGDLVDVAAQARTQLGAHLVPVALAWREAASAKEKAAAKKGELADAAREALREGGVEAASRALAAFDVVIPGLGLAAQWAMRGVGGVKDRFEERRDIRTEVDLGQRADDHRRSVSSELAGLLRGVAHREVPAIVVIEDLHLMGDGLVELLDLLSVPDDARPVVVIGTAWPQREEAPIYGAWREQATASGLIQVETVPYLAPAQLARIVRAYAPETTDEVAMQAADRYPNPLSLEVTLSLKQVEDAIVTNRGALPPEALSARSPKLSGVYRDQFWELSEEVQVALATAAGSLPTSEHRVWPFVRSVVAEAARRCPGVGAAATDVLAGIERAADGQVWLVPSGVADSFREALHAQIAYEHFRDVLAGTNTDSLRNAVVSILTERIDETRGEGIELDDSDETSVLSRWLLAVASPSGRSPALLAAAFRVAMELAAAYQFVGAIEILEPRLGGQFSIEHRDGLAIRFYLASWLREVGRTSEAITSLEELLTDELRILGPDHPDTLITRNDLASSLGAAGRTNDTITAFEGLLDDQLRILGPDHPDTLITRSNLASTLGEAGHTVEATSAMEELLSDQVRILGPDHPDTLTTRGNLALSMGEAGRTVDAITAFEELLTDEVRILGPDHPHTLRTRGNLAFHLGRNGRMTEAIAASQELLTDQLRILGPDNPHTLVTRSNFAYWLAAAGRTAEAVTAFQLLVDDQLRLLGPDHPHTLNSRANVASRLGEAGRITEAITAFQELITDQLRVLGSDHPDTLATRSNLADQLGKSGRLDEAIAAYHEIFADQVRVLGSDHPDTLITRNNLASWLARTGRIAEAITAYKELHVDQLRVLGRDHAHTVMTRNNLRQLRRQTGGKRS